MARRRLRGHLLTAVVLGTMVASTAALPVTSASAADVKPGIGEAWPMCGVAPDTDGKYCVVSMARNGAAITHPAAGDYYLPYIDLIGDGDVRFGVLQYRDGVLQTIPNGTTDSVMADGDIPPGDTYQIVVNTGDIVPRELYGHVRNVTFTRGGDATGGYRFGLTMQPTPLAWIAPTTSGEWPCSVLACGDDTTTANPYWTYEGFVTGYVTDLASATPAERSMMTGYVRAYNAQDADITYDYPTNSLIIRLANPHLKAPGVPATGSYETFLPYAMLTGMMNVPDPGSLTGGSLLVQRAGTTTPVPFTLTHERGGVQVTIASITYSTPTYRIKPRRTVPGKPRIRRVVRVAPRAVRVAFVRPVANGGAPIRAYRARCSRGTRSWVAVRAQSPIVLRGLPRARVACQVRAVNAVGAGKWSLRRLG